MIGNKKKFTGVQYGAKILLLRPNVPRNIIGNSVTLRPTKVPMRGMTKKPRISASTIVTTAPTVKRIPAVIG